jgi:hypothetical protein
VSQGSESRLARALGRVAQALRLEVADPTGRINLAGFFLVIVIVAAWGSIESLKDWVLRILGRTSESFPVLWVLLTLVLLWILCLLILMVLALCKREPGDQ